MLCVAAAETGNCIQLIPPYFIHVQKTNNEISKQVALGYLGTEGRTLMWAFTNAHLEGNGQVTASGRVSTGEKIALQGLNQHPTCCALRKAEYKTSMVLCKFYGLLRMGLLCAERCLVKAPKMPGRRQRRSRAVSCPEFWSSTENQGCANTE